MTAINTSLIEQINQAHRDAQEFAGKAIHRARDAGELLIKIKDELPHGEFIPWLEKHCAFSPRTARDYMRVASKWQHCCHFGSNESVSVRAMLESLADEPDTQKIEAEARKAEKRFLAACGELDNLLRARESLPVALAHTIDNAMGRAIDEYFQALREFWDKGKRCIGCDDEIMAITLCAITHHRYQSIERFLELQEVTS